MATKLYIGSIHNKKDRDSAAQIAAEGEVIGVFNRGVNALWTSGEHPDGITRLHAIKGEEGLGKPVALTIDFNQLVEMLDSEYISPQVKDFIKLAGDLKQTLGSLCFLRVPIKSEYVLDLPLSAVSQDVNNRAWVQTWDAHGHKPTEQLLSKMRELGVKYPVVTSMNNFGEPELVDQQQAIEFCQAKGIQIYLQDTKAHQKLVGSYSILSFDDLGVNATRDGNIPIHLIQRVFPPELVIDTKNSKKPVHPQMEFPPYLTAGLNSKGIRMAILLFIAGNDAQKTNDRLKLLKKYRA